MHKLEEGHRIV